MSDQPSRSIRFRSFFWTMFLVPFLFLPYRWLWLPCGLAGVRLAWPNRLSLRETLNRDGSLIIGSTVVLLLRTALDPGWWLPWIVIISMLCWLRSRPWWFPWMGRILVPTAIILSVVYLLRPSEWPSQALLERMFRQDIRVVCAGDSLTAGVKVGDDSDTYVARLRERARCKIINAGVANDRSADLLARLDRTVLVHKPHIVLVLIGGNDYLDGVPRQNLANSLDQIASRITSSGAKLVIVEVPSGIIWNPYAGVYRRIADKYKAVFVPDTRLRWWYCIELLFRERLAEPLTIDGIHLSPAGASKVAAWLEPYLIIAERQMPR